ncbi:MAG: DUF2282 domain-containing protein [Burkholderiaceae bacterium]
MNRTLATATLAAAVGLALSAPAYAQDKPGMKPMNAEQQQQMERMKKNNLAKCYGIAARGKNDCGEGAHSCVGQSTHDRDKASYVLLPQGDCEKITGGSLKSA